MFKSILQPTGIIETLEPIFKGINNDNWDQSNGSISSKGLNENGNFELGVRCCIGTHIARAFDLNFDPTLNLVKDSHYNYVNGKEFVVRKIQYIFPEVSELMIFALFHCAGAPQYPFSSEPWKRHPSEVLERMKYIGTMPPMLCNRTKIAQYYYKQKDFRIWYKRERERIERCVWCKLKKKELGIP